MEDFGQTSNVTKAFFIMSSRGKLKSVDKIATNLVKVITWTSNKTNETNEGANINNPDNLAIPERAFQSQKDISVALAK